MSLFIVYLKKTAKNESSSYNFATQKFNKNNLMTILERNCNLFKLLLKYTVRIFV